MSPTSDASAGLSETELALQEQHLSDNVMSPFCPGRTLLACPSEEAGVLRKEIASMLRDGKSRPEIEAVLVSRYGEDVRGMPRLEGFGAVAWLTPFIFLLTAAIVVTAILRRSMNRKDFEHAGSERVKSSGVSERFPD